MAIKKEIDHDYYAHLSLNEGAYFFEKGDAVINKTEISKLFEKVADGTKVLERCQGTGQWHLLKLTR